MVEISASMVKELRERSGAAMMDCKKALVESGGNFDRAFEWLRQKGVAAASKKAARIATDGLVTGMCSDDGRVGCLLEVNCETDFVARNPDFLKLTQVILYAALKSRPKTLDALAACAADGVTVADLVTSAVARIGENIVVRRMELLELAGENGQIGLYVHPLGGKMGALIELASQEPVERTSLAATAREIGMHIVSARPEYVSRCDVPESVLADERRIESGKADLAGKPPEIQSKIVEGRVNKIIAERCLSEQPFVKDPGITVLEFLKRKGKELGAELTPGRFAIFVLGEVAQDSSDNGCS